MSDVEQRITIELNPRERRLYDQLRARVVDAPPGAASSLRDLMLVMPDLTVMLVRLLRDTRVPRGSKLVALAGLGYVLSPIDLVPALLFGPIGLVDDLIVLSATLSRLVNHVHPDVVRDAWPGQGDALAAIKGLASWSEGIFGARMRHALRGLLRVDSRAEP